MKTHPSNLSVSLLIGLIFISLGIFRPITAQGAWQLVWSDEFTNADGSSPDPSKWAFNTGGGGWGNNELEYYTSRTNNARIQGGQLVIEADKENYNGNNYTSARLLTQGKWSWTYGRMEARIKIPRGQGIWPAFWMLGTNITPVGWPTCGEIDIMENIGNTSDQGNAHGTIHGPQTNSCGGDYNCGGGVGGTYTLPGGAALADDYHIYAVEWSTNLIQWFVDNNLYFTARPASLPANSAWVFTAPQFIILNVAVGGNWPGNPDGTTVFPQQMLVDYVRVYSYVASAPDAPTGLTVGVGNSKAYLDWNSTSGAGGYIVKRATTSGGSYTPIATTATNSYIDNTVSSCASYYYVVSATNAVGESTNSTEAVAALGAYAMSVNSGGSTAVQFVSDTSVSGGTQAAPVTVGINTNGVVAPAPQAVYQTERYGNFTYTFTGLTPGQNYRVRLHFAENYWTAVGQRRFNVFINGAQVLSNFDIIAAAGTTNKANVQEFTTPANGSGQMVIQYATVTDNAKSSGIEVLLPQPDAPVVTNNGPIWAGMTLNLTASTVAGASYYWTGPNGFSSTAQNPSIVTAATNASGTYNATVTVNGCTSSPATTSVTVNPPVTVSFMNTGSNLTISWPAGTLQTATNVAGTWYDLIGATNLYIVTPTNPQQFYRTRLP